jgi:hypothetical protein
VSKKGLDSMITFIYALYGYCKEKENYVEDIFVTLFTQIVNSGNKRLYNRHLSGICNLTNFTIYGTLLHRRHTLALMCISMTDPSETRVIARNFRHFTFAAAIRRNNILNVSRSI